MKIARNKPGRKTRFIWNTGITATTPARHAGTGSMDGIATFRTPRSSKNLQNAAIKMRGAFHGLREMKKRHAVRLNVKKHIQLLRN